MSNTCQTMPHDLATERSILGALIRDNRNMDRVGDLGVGHFYNPLHGQIFEVIEKLVARGRLADAGTIRHIFAKSADVEIYDGAEGKSVPQYVEEMEVHAVSREKLSEYVATVRDLSTRRSMIVIGEDMIAAAHAVANGNAPEADITEVESRLYSLKRQSRGSKAVTTAYAAMGEALAEAEQAYQRGNGLAGLSTGIVKLDEVMGGLAEQNLVVIAGRPGMGKSALAFNIARNIALGGAPVGIMSLEMSGADVGRRLLSEGSGVPAWALRKGDIRSDEQWRALIATVEDYRDFPFFIDQSGGLSLAQLVMRSRRMASEHGIKLLVVDYLQLVTSSGGKNGNRVQEVTEITMGLKALAKELNIPVVALSQLSRNVESRENKRPIMPDLRESGSIEQDADCIAFVYRESYYTERDKPAEGTAEFYDWQRRMAEVSGKAEVIIGKNRHGPAGAVAELEFNASTISFS